MPRMTRIYLIISVTMLAVNLIMEYATLTKRRGLAAHVLARGAAAVLTVLAILALRRLGLLRYYGLRAVATLPFFASCLYLFEESVAQKTFLYFMDYSANALLSTLCLWIAAMLPLGSFEDLASSALYVLVVIVFLPLYYKRIRSRVRKMLFLFRNSDPLYAAFPVLSFAFFAIVFGPVNVDSSLRWFLTMTLFAAVTVLTYVILFSHFTTVYDRLQAEGDALRAGRQLVLQRKYYEEVQRGLSAQGKLLHDARHHLVAVASMARSGDCAAAERYAAGLEEHYAGTGAASYCENAVVDAVIGGYIGRAEAEGIAVSTDLDLPAAIGIDEYELCSFFGNALENAVEACERIPELSPLRSSRFVSIAARLEGGRLAVRVENRFPGETGRGDQGFSSSKGSGIGLESMRAVVDKYRGSMSCERRGTVFALSAEFRLGN